jgi:hypothetical protein
MRQLLRCQADCTTTSKKDPFAPLRRPAITGDNYDVALAFTMILALALQQLTPHLHAPLAADRRLSVLGWSILLEDGSRRSDNLG